MIQPAPRVRAFTLIELLVTISLIAVLIAIVTPAIVKASTTAEEVKCLANVRSIGQATIAYTADYDRKFPVGIGNDLNLLNLVGKTGGNNAIGRVAAEDRLLYDYLSGQTDMAECPLDAGFDTRASGFEWFGSSYLYMDSSSSNPSTVYRARNNIWSLEGHRVTKVSAPARKMMIGEATVIRSASNANHFWHNDQANLKGSMVFVDGHTAVTEHKLDQNGSYSTVTKATLEDWARTDEYY